MPVPTVRELELGNHDKLVVSFGASWHEACHEDGLLDQVLSALDASTGDDVHFCKVDVDECATLVEQYSIQVVPTVVLLNNGSAVDRVEGVDDVSQLTQKVTQLVAAAPADYTGTNDNAINDSLATSIAAPLTTPEQRLATRLDGLIRTAPVMLFIKGTPTAPRCGFSRTAVELLESESISFASFDILSDEAVRQGLKAHSNWPTYPQLYVNGELAGGLDIMKEMKAEGSLRDQLNIKDEAVSGDGHGGTAAAPTLNDRLRSLTHRHPVMLFMKGVPSAPRCGFSSTIVQILNDLHASYDAFDILTDEDVRQGLKTYSNWPTYPQLYVNGDLVGGLDIVQEMKDDGSLQEMLLQAAVETEQ